MKKQFKRGATSFYIVIFATLLLSVIVVSFITIMTSNIKNTVNEDLSVSAYDSALAGIEDAKIALTKYHNCLDQGTSASASCQTIISNMQNGIKNDSCDTVTNVLDPTNTSAGPVSIQETSSSNETGSTSMLQAYTCVKISEDLTDYRSTLTSDKRSTVIPLRTSGTQYQQVRALKIMWHQTPEDQDSVAYANGLAGSYPQANLTPRSTTRVPSLLVDLYQTGSNFSVGSLSTPVKKKEVINGSNYYYYTTDHVSILLHPSEYLTPVTDTRQIRNYLARNSYDDSINSRKVPTGDQERNTGVTVGELSDKLNNPVANVKCSNASFMCTAIINLPEPASGTRVQNTFFLRLSLPYADDSGTTFSVTMCKSDYCSGASDLENAENNSSIAYFTGVQARIDSTGRANDVYRRIDTRVELVETGFPFPEYEVWMAGTSPSIEKSFWVTEDCKIKEDSETEIHDCGANSGTVTD